jgi:hypothetical protein
MRKDARRGQRFIEFLNRRVVVFIWAEDRKNLAALSSTLREALAITVAVFYAAPGCRYTVIVSPAVIGVGTDIACSD